MPIRVTLLALLLVAAGFGAPATAQRGPALPYPVKMRGFVGAVPPGAAVLRRWVVRIKSEKYDFAPTTFTVLSGRATFGDIAAAVAPYPVAFELVGADLDVFARTPPGREIEIFGNLRFSGGARLLMISSVRPVAPSPP